MTLISLSLNLMGQSEYPYQQVIKNDTVVIMLKSQAVKVNETLSGQRNRIKLQQQLIDSLSNIKRRSDTVICRYTILDTLRTNIVDTIKIPHHRTALAVPDQNYLIYNWVDSTERWELDPRSYDLDKLYKKEEKKMWVVGTIFIFMASLATFLHFTM